MYPLFLSFISLFCLTVPISKIRDAESWCKASWLHFLICFPSSSPASFPAPVLPKFTPFFHRKCGNRAPPNLQLGLNPSLCHLKVLFLFFPAPLRYFAILFVIFEVFLKSTPHYLASLANPETLSLPRDTAANSFLTPFSVKVTQYLIKGHVFL